MTDVVWTGPHPHIYAADDGGTLHLRAVSNGGPARLTVVESDQLLDALEQWLAKWLEIDYPEGLPPFAQATRRPVELDPATSLDQETGGYSFGEIWIWRDQGLIYLTCHDSNYPSDPEELTAHGVSVVGRHT